MREKTHYERIVGGTDEERTRAAKTLQEIFNERSENLSKYELDKTPEDLEVLADTEIIVDNIVARYGGEPKPIPLDHIYILKPGSVSIITERKFTGGIHMPLGLKVGVEKKGESKLLFASTVAHELFHLKSYKSARVGESEKNVRLYRAGLSMIGSKGSNDEMGNEKEYFAILEEAIVAECTKKFLDEASFSSVFGEEARAVRKFRDWVAAYYRGVRMSEEKVKEFEKELKYIADPQGSVERVLASSSQEGKQQAYAAGMFGSMYEKGSVETMERYIERKRLYEFLDRLVVNSNGKFENRDRVFDEFAKANFSGNYLPIARTIEGALGKGSFRRLAEEFSEE